MIIKKKIKRLVSILFCFVNWFFVSSQAYAQTEITFEKLLEGYILKDRNYAVSKIDFQSALLDYQKTGIENGFSVEFSTGIINFQKENNGSEISFSPSTIFSIPSWRNSKITISTPVSIVNNTSKNSNIVSYDNVGGLLSTDVFSSTQKKLEISQLSAERSLFTAKQDYSKSIEQAEKRFLTELQTLFTERKTLLEAEEDLVDSQISFDTVKAKGYAEKSAKYRTTLLQLQSNQLTYDQKKRSFETTLALFCDKCGIENKDLEIDIPDVELLKIENFQQSDFVELDTALWTNKINTLTRDSETAWSLTGKGGYSFSKNNSTTSGDTLDSETKHNLKAGASLNWNGLTVETMFALPVNDLKNPSVSLSVGFKPTDLKIANIEAQENKLLEQKEDLSIQDATSKYDSSVIENTEEYQTLNWQIKKNEEELALYTELEKDMKAWLSNGIIANSEYRTAKINLENSKIQFQLTKILRRLYNINLKNLFLEKEQDEK